MPEPLPRYFWLPAPRETAPGCKARNGNNWTGWIKGTF